MPESKRNDIQVAKGNEPSVPSRRRLLHGGLAAGPVLLTLASRPVLGAACVTPSAFYSGNASVAGTPVLCNGQTAEYWINNPSWPAPLTQATPFNDVFVNSPYQCETLLDVLNAPDNGALDHTAPALLGHHKGQQVVRKPPKVRDSGTGTSGANQGPLGHKSLALGFSDDDSVEEESDQPAPLDQRSLKIGGPIDRPAVIRPTKPTDDVGRNLSHQRRHSKNTPDPVASDPTPAPEPLGCDSNAAPDPAPVAASDPTTSGRTKKKSNTRVRSSPQHDAVGRGVVTALLNAHAGFTSQPSVSVVKDIWQEYATKGYFEPTAGVQWAAPEILTYLASSQSV